MLAASVFAQLALYSLACLGAGAAGRRVLTRTLGSLETLSPLGRLASDFILGLGLLACAWLLLALAGWFSPAAIGVLLVASWIACAMLSRGDFREGMDHLRSMATELRRGPASLAILALLTVGWMLFGFTALATPLSGDSLALHMLIPKVVADSHQLTTQFFNSRISYFGVQGEMHHAALLSLASPDAAKLFSWPTMMAGALMLVSICGKCGAGRPGKWLALLILYTSTGVLWWIGEGKIDIYSTALGLAAVRWLLPGTRTRADVALGAMLAAFTIQAKLAYGLTLAPILAFLYFWPLVFRSGPRMRGELGRLGVAAGAFALAMAPHIAKNLLLFGSIVGTTETAGNLPTFLEERWYSAETRSRIQLLAPLILTFGDYFAQYGTLSPLVLAFLPLALLMRGAGNPAHGILLPLSLAPLLTLVPWFIAYPDKVVTRYLLVPLLLWIPLAARAAENVAYPPAPDGMQSGWKAHAPLAKALLIAVLLALLWRVSRLQSGFERFFAGTTLAFAFLAYLSVSPASWRPLGSRLLGFVALMVAFVVYFSTVYRTVNYLFYPAKTVAYLSGRIQECDWQHDWCRAASAVNAVAARGERIFSSTTYKYFLRPDLIQCASSGEEVNRIAGFIDRASGRAELVERGFRFALIDKRDGDGAGRVRELLTGSDVPPSQVEVLFAEGPLTLYKVLRQDAAADARYECRQLKPPAWTVVKRESR
jgi:hypothetical protein